MAITDTRAPIIEPVIPAAQPTVNGQQQQAWSLHDGSFFGAPIGRGVGSEYLSELSLALQEAYKDARKDMELSLLTVDNVNYSGLAYSSIVVCTTLKGVSTSPVAYHILLVEATGEAPEVEVVQQNNLQIEITKVAGDAIDAVLKDLIRKKVAETYPNRDLIPTDACVVPASFDVSKKSDVHKLALNAGTANGVALSMRQPGWTDMNLKLMPQDSNLSINIGFKRQTVEDAVGHPTRSDVQINFTSQRAVRPGAIRSMNAKDRDVRVSSVNGFMDCLWVDNRSVAQQGGWGIQQQQQQVPNFAARFVITDMVNNRALTPGAVLLTLATAMTLNDNANWLQSFKPDAGVVGLDLRDVGALNVEANLKKDPSGFGQPINTKAESFKLQDLGTLISMLFRQEMLLSVDVPEAGPQTWYLAFLADAANGDGVAVNLLLQTCSQLTDGHFDKYFSKNAPLFVDTHQRVHLGTWQDRAGNFRDIREFDYLAAANKFGTTDPTFIADWSDTFTRTQFPLEQRLAARKKMIQGMSGDTAVFDGFAQRVTPSGNLLVSLMKGLIDAGLAPRVTTPMNAGDFNSQRGVAGFVNNAVLTQGQFFTNGSGFGGAAAYSNYNGRW